MRTTFLALTVLLATTAANATIEFVGYTSSGKTQAFALIDTADGRAKFLELGANFAGYRVAEYVKETETLTLMRESEVLAVKLRSATFMIPPEVTGVEREKQFFEKMKEMRPKPGLQNKSYYVEDYVATASQYGREIVFYDVKDGEEVIVMELPEAKRMLPNENGVVHKMTFQALMLCRDKKTKVKLTVR